MSLMLNYCIEKHCFMRPEPDSDYCRAHSYYNGAVGVVANPSIEKGQADAAENPVPEVPASESWKDWHKTDAATTEAVNIVVRHNNVEHPSHYNQGGIECIDAIQAALTPEAYEGFLAANSMKYLWRERNKGNDEDLEKAAWYLSRLTKEKK